MNWTKALKYLDPWIKAQKKIHVIEQVKRTKEISDLEKAFCEHARDYGVIIQASDPERYISGVEKLYDEFNFCKIASIQRWLRLMRYEADLMRLDLYNDVIRRNLGVMQ